MRRPREQLQRAARAKVAARARKIASVADDLRPGESVIVNYCSDVTACGCSTHDLSGVPCVRVATTSTGYRTRSRLIGRTDRCLNCGTIWRARYDRAQPLEVLEVAA